MSNQEKNENPGLTIADIDHEDLAAADRAGDPFARALYGWLEGKSSETRRSYLKAVTDFFSFVDVHPREVDPADVAAFKEHLKEEGLSDSSIAQRLSALSSYFQTLTEEREKDEPLRKYNPVNGVNREDLEVTPYEKAKTITLDEFRAILEEIDTDKPTGARDRALFLFYFLCARRRAEVINITAEDLRKEGETILYRARLKGGDKKWKQLPPPVADAIKNYMNVAGRDPHGDDPIFIAHTDRAKYLLRHQGKDPKGAREEKPISGEAVSQALKRYARQAGIDPDRVSLHSLRHLGAEVYYKQSGDIKETQDFLDHAKSETTDLYLQQLTGEEHRHWKGMFDELTGEEE